MAASTTTSRITASRRPPVLTGKSRFDRRLSSILAHATNVFYEKGYEGASMRDLSRASGMSLAGMYHYFESKEKLLDRKSTRLNSSHGYISYAVFCLKKKKKLCSISPFSIIKRV